MLYIEREKVVFAKDILNNRPRRGSFEIPKDYYTLVRLKQKDREDRNIRKIKKAPH